MIRGRHAWTALALLVVLAVCRFGWRAVPEQHEADAWNIAQALLIIALLALLAVSYHRSPCVLAALTLGGAWQAMTAACSAAYIVQPWQVLPGQEQCDAALDAPISTIGLWLALLLVAQLVAQRGAHRDAHPE